jgi:hypothetical protein
MTRIKTIILEQLGTFFWPSTKQFSKTRHYQKTAETFFFQDSTEKRGKLFLSQILCSGGR